MRRRRVTSTAAAIALLASLAAACQLIAGIENHGFTVDEPVAEAGPPDTSVPEAASLPDPCAHKMLPPRPDAAFDEIKGFYVFAVRTADFSGADDAGTPLGYDLDGVCTCDTRPGAAHAGAASCTAPGSTPCDYDAGVDNALYAPFRAAAGFLGDSGNGSALLGNQTECGRETLLIVLGDYNGLADDPKVRVGLLPSFGIQEPHDAGDDPDSSCGNSGAPPYPAKWDGTDIWTYKTGTGLGSGVTIIPAIGTSDAYVTGYRLVVPPVGAISVFLGTAPVEISSPATVATLQGVDAFGNDVPSGTTPVGFRLRDGVLSGRVAVGALLQTIGLLVTKSSINPSDIIPVCQDVLKGEVIRKQICNGRDIQSDPAKDFQPPGAAPFACDAVSTAVRFTADMAQVGDPYLPDAGPDAGCPADWPVCP